MPRGRPTSDERARRARADALQYAEVVVRGAHDRIAEERRRILASGVPPEDEIGRLRRVLVALRRGDCWCGLVSGAGTFVDHTSPCLEAQRLIVGVG